MKTRPDLSDRALALREKGVEVAQIAERLGRSPNTVNALIYNAKARRAKESTANTVAEMEGR